MKQAGSTTFIVDSGRLLLVVFLSCVIIEIALVYLDLTVNWQRWSEAGSIRRLFNITREDGLASWFAVTQTVFVAVAAWIIWAVNTRKNVSSRRRIGWLVVALFFSYMAVDDGAAVHERLGSAFKQNNDMGGFPSYAWQMLLLPFFAGMGVFILFFLWRELPRARDRWLVAAAIGCFATAVAMDFVEGMEDGYRWLIDSFGWRKTTIAHFSKSIEEFIEMLGMTLLLITFLSHITHSNVELCVRFDDTNSKP